MESGGVRLSEDMGDNSGDCIPNIGPREKRRRWIVGISALIFAIAVAVVLLATDAPRASRLLLLAPFWVGALALFEAASSTCVVLAARGTRNMDQGETPIGSPAELGHVRQQSRRVHIRALLLSAALTAVVYAI
jgi:hypothetical protein